MQQTRPSTEHKDFAVSHRSLRVWPIEGSDSKSMEESVVGFFCQVLGAPRIGELGIKYVRRVRSAPRGIACMEVLVEFTDDFARDDILSRGPMLADYRDHNNKPSAGIRLDIPQHLLGVFKTLEAFGYALKRRHGAAFRKHIKFNEYARALYIQVGIKDQKSDERIEWRDYSAEEARDGLKTLNAKKGPSFDFLSSPPATANFSNLLTTTSTTSPSTSAAAKMRGSGSGLPWKPPALEKSGMDWRQGRKDEEEEIEIDP